MTDSQFTEQGGAATMDPDPVLRWLTSSIVNRVKSPQRQERQRRRAERKRVKAGARHVVEYFHQVDDGYSHLAAQRLADLAARYDIELRCHLVSAGEDKNNPEPELLLQLSRNDAATVAPEYGLDFPAITVAPSQAQLELAAGILAAQDDSDFTRCAPETGRALWSGDAAALERLAAQYGSAEPGRAAARLAAGNARRTELGHYSGAMFFYAGEWYWGIDRLYHLEARLATLGADRRPDQPPLAPRPDVAQGPLRDNGSLTLQIYASLRSPYTALVFDRTVALAEATGVRLEVRPVLPMVMRGVPATRTKGMYIFFDAAREARAAHVPFDRFYDPIGDPARNGYALYRWACTQGRGVQMFSALLSCAFAEGVNLNRDSGLRRAVENAGLDWTQAKQALGDASWQDELEANRLVMYDSGLWGVPSYRLLDESGNEILALWGQDRLWLFAREIQRQLQRRQRDAG